MSQGYFITATGTGVGKTFTTCALIHAARARNIAVSACKPLLSGAEESPTDCDLLRDALGVMNDTEITRWKFKAPLSPHRAAALEDKAIAFDELIAFSRGGVGLRLVEGVGGVMVPLDNRHTVLDWMVALGWPVILVAGSYLGTISHTLSALEVLHQRGLNVPTLVINESENSTVSLAETMAGLAPFIGAIPLRVAQPRVLSPAQATEIHSLIGTLV